MHRYPNIIEPFTNNIYQNLRDGDSSVRKTTLLVITHLILNDMLKVNLINNFRRIKINYNFISSKGKFVMSLYC